MALLKPIATPLDYQTPSPASLNPPRHGRSSLLFGSAAACSTYFFLDLQSRSPIDPASLLCFPLVSAIPILALTGITHGLDALSFRRPLLAVPGLVLSCLSLAVLARTLFGSH
jgi:hypothetical protein